MKFFNQTDEIQYMVDFSGIRNRKTGSGRLEHLVKLVGEAVRIDQQRRQKVRTEAFLRAYNFVWELPKLDPQNVTWVGVEPYAPEALGRLQVSVMEQRVKKPGGQPTVEEALVDWLNFSCLCGAEDIGFGLPVPLAVNGRRPLSASGLEQYPINQQGFIGKLIPTKRVHTLVDYLKEPDVWPAQYSWALPYLPVYSLTAFVPLPSEKGSEATDFNSDYCFQLLSGDRSLVVHRIVEDRILPGYIYQQSHPLFSGGPMPIMDVSQAEKNQPKYHLFRAEEAPGLDQVSLSQEPSVFGRFLIIVMQQPRPKPLFETTSAPLTFDLLGLTKGTRTLGATVTATRVAVGQEVAPVSVGEGVEIDPVKLPIIFDIRVLGVRENDLIDGTAIDQAGKIIPFPRTA